MNEKNKYKLSLLNLLLILQTFLFISDKFIYFVLHSLVLCAYHRLNAHTLYVCSTCYSKKSFSKINLT